MQTNYHATKGIKMLFEAFTNIIAKQTLQLTRNALNITQAEFIKYNIRNRNHIYQHILVSSTCCNQVQSLLFRTLKQIYTYALPHINQQQCREGKNKKSNKS